MASSTAPLTPVSRASAPSTPSGQKIQQATPSASGTWKHPRFDEITRRQYATTFDERNVKIILANGTLLLFSFVGPTIASQVAVLRTLVAYVILLAILLMHITDPDSSHRTPLHALINTLPYHEWIIFAIRLVLVANIAIQLLPLARRYYPDDIADIPLTPSQRQIMGIKADVPTPQTPGSAYASPNFVTPPRYQKSTPRSSFSNQGDRASQSPLSGSPRASMANSTSNSPFSPSTASPLFQRALGGSVQKRLSYGGGTPSSSIFGDSSSSATPGTPTPGTGKASVGLNNKWLYEKRRDSPRSNLFS
jgi:nucleoporin POM34